MAFAKLYGDGDDQILVKLDECLDGGQPEVRFYFQPPELGVCSLAIKFEDSDAGWDEAETAFAAVTQESAREVVNKQISILKG